MRDIKSNTQLIGYFTAGLRQQGYKATTQRRAVFETLLRYGSTTNSLLANRLQGRLDRATTYRIITLFETLGFVTRSWNGFKSTIELSDAFVAHHHHATCTHCGGTQRVESSEVEQALIHVTDSLAFTMTEHSLELRGLCQQCQIKPL